MRLDPAEWLGREVSVVVDRPLGTRLPDYPDTVYTVNYGYIPDTMAADGDEIDAYLLGPTEPVERAEGTVIAVVLRADDIEDKLVVAVGAVSMDADEIAAAVAFMEKHFSSRVVTASQSE